MHVGRSDLNGLIGIYIDADKFLAVVLAPTRWSLVAGPDRQYNIDIIPVLFGT